MKRLSAPGRLRLLLGTLFLALALPSAFLIWRTERQIRLEGWHQQRESAETLTRSIDAALARLVQREEARSYGDYRFLTVAGDSTRGVLSQRSPLAQLPGDSDIPGLLGHFQVDPEGSFSTPLLPDDASAAADLGMDAEERQTRLDLRTGLIDVLGRNQLLARDVASGRPIDAALATTQASNAEDGRLAAQVAFDLLNMAPPAAPPLAESARTPEDSDPTQKQSVERNARRERSAVVQQSLAAAESTQRPVSAFAEDATAHSQPLAGVASEGVGEAELDRIVVSGSRIRRADADPGSTRPPQALEPAILPAPRIDIFESVIDPFEFSRLDSGHFVLFRRVWNEGGRSIQGLLLDPDSFVESELLAPFRASSLTGAASLHIGWRGAVVASVPASGPFDEALHRHRLSAPYGDIELNLRLHRLDPGPGAMLTRWTGAVLLLVLLLGFLLLYRLGLGQLRLARQQQDFVAAVSHELKTPLTSIRMYGELLREGWVADAKRREYYAYIHDESERLSRLIGNVLQLARMERQELALDMKPMNTAELFDLVRSRLAGQIERAGFQAHFECDPAVRTRQLLVDRDALLQILINLVDNALKFSAQAEIRRIDVAVREGERGSIEFSVRDHGPGVPRAQMRRIFELFYRAADTLGRETAGTGIGLALVHQLATAMDGKVDVINRHPGAEFRLHLPGKD